jgi:UPF0716 protein FxsA
VLSEALFTLLVVVEVALLYVVGGAIGFWPTAALILLTGVLGAVLGKREGLKVWRAWREALAAGRVPEEGMLGGVLVLVGGVLLMLPGVLSDLAGVALLIPPARRAIARLVQARLEKRFGQGGSHFQYRVEVGNADVLRGLHTYVRSTTGQVSKGAQGDVIDTDGEVIEERRRGDPKAHLSS